MTHRLYLDDAYLRQFEACVSAVEPAEDGVWIELDRTAFYAESGGQPPDRGSLGSFQIEDVQLRDGRHLHLTGESGLQVGDSVAGSIDWDRRFDHMQQHTGQHILSQAFIRTLDVQTVSFHLGREISTIDLEVEALEPGQIYKAEDLANQVVFENRETRLHEVDSSEQSRFPLRKPSPRTGSIRIVEISDFDWSPCGGTHCARAGEVGLIKIRRWERSRGRARVEFVCGLRSLSDYRRKNRILYQLTQLLSVPQEDLVEAAAQQGERLDSREAEVRGLQKQLIGYEASRLAATAEKTGGIELIRRELEGIDAAQLRQLALDIVNAASNRVVLFGLGGDRPLLLLARSPDLESLDLRPILAEAAQEIDGRGGGSAQLVQAGGSRLEGLAGALDKAHISVKTFILK